MNKNYYWPVYLNLEKELIELTNQIHIDDKQLNVYSVKISELLIRTVVEIEALSKELYLTEGGEKNDDNELYFDTDCLNFLNQKWILDKKELLISSPLFFIDKIENKVITPLFKSGKRGSSSSDWQKAYQAVKHNRIKSLEKGNLNNFIKALGALFILNIYYKDVTFQLGDKDVKSKFDSSLNSDIFSVEVFSTGFNLNLGTFQNNDNYLKSSYIIIPIEDTIKEFNELNANWNEAIQVEVFKRLQDEGYLEQLFNIEKPENHDEISNALEEIKKNIERVKNDFAMEARIATAQKFGLDIYNAQNKIHYKAILNKS